MLVESSYQLECGLCGKENRINKECVSKTDVGGCLKSDDEVSEPPSTPLR